MNEGPEHTLNFAGDGQKYEVPATDDRWLSPAHLLDDSGPAVGA